MKDLKSRFEALGEFFADFYFRARLIVRGSRRQGSSVIYVMNHSGMNFPWDCFILFILLKRSFGKAFSLTPLSAPALFQHRVLHPFGTREFWRLFCEEATLANFEHLAARNQDILVNPEGIGGLAKGFNHRYELQKFSTSFVRVALKYNKAVVPIYAVNAEYLNPFAYKSDRMNAFARRFGVPFLSFGLFTPLYILFPFALYISLPARLRYVVGPELDVRSLLPEALQETSYEDLDGVTIRNVCELVRAQMQTELNHAVLEHGSTKYDWSEFFMSAWRLGSSSWKLLPLTWPLLFLQVESAPGASLHSKLIKVVQVLPVLGWPLYILLLAWPDQQTVPHAPLQIADRSAMKKAL